MLDNSNVFIKSLKPMIVNLAQSLAQDCKTGWRNTGKWDGARNWKQTGLKDTLSLLLPRNTWPRE